MPDILIGYDLEGPISSLDHAYEVCKKFVPNGAELFSVLSRYDDILALENKEGYEPGDTLKLITPFLIASGVTEKNMVAVSQEASLVPGIKELFDYFLSYPRVISTSFHQHAHNIGEQLGLYAACIYCTNFPIGIYSKMVSQEDIEKVSSLRKKIVELYSPMLEIGENDQDIKGLLAPFFWQELPKTSFGPIMEKVNVIGGRRKVAALQSALLDSKVYYLDRTIVVGDSITDWRMLQVVEAAGGLAVAWNANLYALPWATCSVTATNAWAVEPLIWQFRIGGRPAVRQWIERAPLPDDPEVGPYYHWVAGQDEETLKRILKIHKRLRTTCRGAETSRLG